MEEIPVEYNIIIEALNSAIQNQQQSEERGNVNNFEFVVINGEEQNEGSVVSSEERVQSTVAGPTENSHITIESIPCENSEPTPDVLVTSANNVGTVQVGQAILSKEKNAASLTNHEKTLQLSENHGSGCARPTFNDLETLLAHEITHSGDKDMHNNEEFQSTEGMSIEATLHCDKSSSDVSTTVISSSVGKALKCQVCGEEFEKQTKLKKHLKSHGVNLIKYQCDVCEKFFNVESALIVHKRKHTGEKPHTCDQCGRMFSQIGNLNRHKITHTDYKPYQCETCEKRFNRLDLLKAHEKIHAMRENGFPCNFCTEVFSLMQDLKSHKKSAHPVLRCKSCKSKFYDPVQFEKHMKAHRRDHPYKCNICEICYADAASLVSHIEAHVKKELVCEICGKVFDKLGSMKQHMRKHTGERPFVCDICGMSFSQIGNMRRHRDNHSDERPLKCSFCPKTFKRKDLMKTHEKVHLPKNLRHKKLDKSDSSASKVNSVSCSDINVVTSNSTGQNLPPSDVDATSVTAQSTQAPMLIHTEENIEQNNMNSSNEECQPMIEGTNTSSSVGEENPIFVVLESGNGNHQASLSEVVSIEGKENTQSQEDLMIVGNNNHAHNEQRSQDFHIQIHHSNNGENCHNTDALTEHIRIHEGSASLSSNTNPRNCTSKTTVLKKQHVCDVCNRQFQQQSALIIHKRTHTGERPYACDQCDLKFAQRGNLIRHQRKHTGVKPFKCQKCDKCFHRKDFLKLHELKCSAVLQS